RRLGAGQVEQVLDVANALDIPRPVHELVDQLRPVDLAAELNDPVLDVDVDPALGHVRRTEDLGLDLLGERGVVEVLRLLVPVLHRLRHAVDPGADAAARPLRATAAAADEREASVAELVPPPLSLARIGEICKRGPESCAESKKSCAHFGWASFGRPFGDT